MVLQHTSISAARTDISHKTTEVCDHISAAGLFLIRYSMQGPYLLHICATRVFMKPSWTEVVVLPCVHSHHRPSISLLGANTSSQATLPDSHVTLLTTRSTENNVERMANARAYSHSGQHNIVSSML